jgi:hypothetical protein
MTQPKSIHQTPLLATGTLMHRMCGWKVGGEVRSTGSQLKNSLTVPCLGPLSKTIPVFSGTQLLDFKFISYCQHSSNNFPNVLVAQFSSVL